MKAVVFETRLTLDDLRIVEIAPPAVGPRQILLRMRAASLNHRDLAIAGGGYAAYPLPLIPLSDGVGTVIEVGAEVRRFKIGDLVSPSYVPEWIDGPIRQETALRRLGGPVDGVLRELMCLDEDKAVRVPAHLDAAEAATLPIAGVTAWQALFANGELSAGHTVAVQGSGGVSLFVVQLARAAGLRVLSILRGNQRRETLERLGAEVFDSTATEWPARVRAATDGRGVDSFVDVVGGPMLSQAIESTRIGGTVVMLGFVGGTSVTLDLISVIRRAVTLRAISGGSRTSFERLVQFMEERGIRPVVAERFAFDQFREAYEYLHSNRPMGKVVIDFDQSIRGIGQREPQTGADPRGR
jgi:NADPH:quinone reductase-like Zn-dependent oxidoreductase